MSSLYGSWLGILWMIVGLALALVWLVVGILALRRARFAGSWLLLAGGVFTLLTRFSGVLFQNPWGSYGVYQLTAVGGGVLTTACLAAGMVLWIQRATALQRRVDELEGIVRSMRGS